MKQCITFGRHAAECPHCYNVVFKGRNIKSNEFTEELLVYLSLGQIHMKNNTMVHQTVNIMTVTVGSLFNDTIILTVPEMRFPIDKSKLYIISLCLSFLHLFLSALP